MDEQNRNPPGKLDIAAFEGDSFGALFNLYKNATDLLRQSGLDDDKLALVSQRIEQLLADATVEMKRSQHLNLAGPLESAYEELKSLVDELADPQGSGDSGDDPVRRGGESG